MNAQNYTQKSLEAIQAAQKLTIENQNQQIEQIHLLAALLKQENGLVPQLLKKMGVTLESFEAAVDAELAKLPRVIQYPVAGDALRPSAEALHARLEALDRPCVLHTVEGAYHGYIEDAENLEVCCATSLPETIAARPAEFARIAAEAMRGSLDELLGAPVHDVPFDPDNARKGASSSLMEEEVR